MLAHVLRALTLNLKWKPMASAQPEPQAPAPAPLQLSDGVDVRERADRIICAEPVLENAAAARSGLGCAFTEVGHAAHGTNLAATLSALRNTDAQLVPVEELGKLRGTGATPDVFFDPGEDLTKVVFAADLLHFGGAAMETAENYARAEAGMKGKADGTTTIRRSEASLIPAVLVGDLADPNGKGAALNKHFQDMMGMMIAEVQETFEVQIIGERMIIRSIFVAHPTDPDQDSNVVELARELVRRVEVEQGCGDRGIRVGLLRGEPAEFKRAHAGKQVVTHADLRTLL